MRGRSAATPTVIRPEAEFRSLEAASFNPRMVRRIATDARATRLTDYGLHLSLTVFWGKLETPPLRRNTTVRRFPAFGKPFTFNGISLYRRPIDEASARQFSGVCDGAFKRPVSQSTRDRQANRASDGLFCARGESCFSLASRRRAHRKKSPEACADPHRPVLAKGGFHI